jgi:hypothetical protein
MSSESLESLTPREAGQLATQLEAGFDRTLGLGFPSIFELRALLGKARCSEARRDRPAPIELWQSIASKYPGVTSIAELDQLRRRLEALDEIPRLAARLAAADMRTRRWAARRLSWLGHAAAPAIPALIDALRDPDGRVRHEAESALDTVYRPGPSQAELLRRLSNSQACVRRRAAWELGQLGQPAHLRIAETQRRRALIVHHARLRHFAEQRLGQHEVLASCWTARRSIPATWSGSWTPSSRCSSRSPSTVRASRVRRLSGLPIRFRWRAPRRLHGRFTIMPCGMPLTMEASQSGSICSPQPRRSPSMVRA